jgi:hypothetical protein
MYNLLFLVGEKTTMYFLLAEATLNNQETYVN